MKACSIVHCKRLHNRSTVEPQGVMLRLLGLALWLDACTGGRKGVARRGIRQVLPKVQISDAGSVRWRRICGLGGYLDMLGSMYVVSNSRDLSIACACTQRTACTPYIIFVRVRERSGGPVCSARVGSKTD
jgi:hypothetical protein